MSDATFAWAFRLRRVLFSQRSSQGMSDATGQLTRFATFRWRLATEFSGDERCHRFCFPWAPVAKPTRNGVLRG